jgi:pimeloyl-ACP methyl ester carboxylesterase
MTGAVMRQHHVTSADGTKISVSITGTGPPLVVSPGSLATAEDWQFVADALAPRMTSYAVDRRGHGASRDSPSFSIEREQEDIAAVLDQAGPDATLLGHSYGAVIALGLALRQPPARASQKE